METIFWPIEKNVFLDWQFCGDLLFIILCHGCLSWDSNKTWHWMVSVFDKKEIKSRKKPLNHFWPPPSPPIRTHLNTERTRCFSTCFPDLDWKGKQLLKPSELSPWLMPESCSIALQRVMQYDAILLELVASTSQLVVCHCLSNCVSSNSQNRPRNSASEPRIARRCTAILRLSSCSWARAHRWLVKHWTQQLTPKGLMSMRLAP